MHFVGVRGLVEVALGDAVGIVGGQGDVHAVVDVAPLGMVVVLLGIERQLCHERKGLFEVAEEETPRQQAAALGSEHPIRVIQPPTRQHR